MTKMWFFHFLHSNEHPELKVTSLQMEITRFIMSDHDLNVYMFWYWMERTFVHAKRLPDYYVLFVNWHMYNYKQNKQIKSEQSEIVKWWIECMFTPQQHIDQTIDLHKCIAIKMANFWHWPNHYLDYRIQRLLQVLASSISAVKTECLGRKTNFVDGSSIVLRVLDILTLALMLIKEADWTADNDDQIGAKIVRWSLIVIVR